MTQNKIQIINIYGSWYLFLLMSIPFLLFPKLLILIFGEKFNDPILYNINLLLLVYCGFMMYYQGLMREIIINESLWFAFATNLVEGGSLLMFFLALKEHGAIGLGFAYILSYIARIGITLPFLLKRKIIDKSILFNKYFFISLFLFISIVIILLFK